MKAVKVGVMVVGLSAFVQAQVSAPEVRMAWTDLSKSGGGDSTVGDLVLTTPDFEVRARSADIRQNTYTLRDATLVVSPEASQRIRVTIRSARLYRVTDPQR